MKQRSTAALSLKPADGLPDRGDDVSGRATGGIAGGVSRADAPRGIQGVPPRIPPTTSPNGKLLGLGLPKPALAHRIFHPAHNRNVLPRYLRLKYTLASPKTSTRQAFPDPHSKTRKVRRTARSSRYRRPQIRQPRMSAWILHEKVFCVAPHPHAVQPIGPRLSDPSFIISASGKRCFQRARTMCARSVPPVMPTIVPRGRGIPMRRAQATKAGTSRLRLPPAEAATPSDSPRC